MTARHAVHEFALGKCIERRVEVDGGWIDGAADIDVETCDHLGHLLIVVKRSAKAIAAYFGDPLWADRALDAEGGAIIRDELANYGMALAQLTALVEDPPELARIAASIQRDVLRDASTVIPFPASRPAAEWGPPPSAAPQDGAERMGIA